MEQIFTGQFLRELSIGYLTLFSIINPFGLSFVFLSMTGGVAPATRSRVARRIGLYSFTILIVSLFIGSQIMNFFGITLPALRIAGGLVVALSGWSMLTAPDEDEEAASPSVRTHESTIDGLTFFPLTVPLTTGPGTIAAAIALGANRSGSEREIMISIVASLFVAMLVAATIVVAYSRAALLSKWAGREGTRVITRLSAFLLMCVGVQIIITGVSDVLPDLMVKASRAVSN